MRKELGKTYNPSEIEDKLYSLWCEKKYFTPDTENDIKNKKKPFTIVIPPPNVTGQLHMGHALDETLQDILIRYKRMQGLSTLWVPGTDHAGIATQIKVEESLRLNEKITRHDLGREKFLERVWEWKEKYGSTIINQLKKLGASCDWSRERFTMDEGCSKAVREVFVNLYEKGLIYRGNRIINWCPHCITALSDAEVEYSEQDGHFWHIRYPVSNSDEYVIIATTRPETMLGDTAVAVNPEDERYAHLIGKTLILPLTDREIPVIADSYVEKDFGTGCVKITPAHDPNDFEVGKRHDLPSIRIMADDASISLEGKYFGLDRYEARKSIVKDLNEKGYLVKIENHKHNVGSCYRCKTTVEPLTSNQWFVKMKPLAKPALESVYDSSIKFEPERFTKIYTGWMENVMDWCISRQLWWGHRIPAFYCDTCGEITVSKQDITLCPKCSASVKQDEDVLDTWFSSALWPFSTLGWPEKTQDLSYYYPTDVLVTGYDIIFFWVARMIFSGLENMGQKPFSTVFIHGLVRDSQGRKMSKSLGNGIDPLEIIEKFGADALRFALATGNSPGNDMRFSDEKIESARNFNNKIWNAARFVMMKLDEEIKFGEPDISSLPTEDKWILSRFNNLVKEVTENLEKFELGIALAKLYDFIWDVFCDWYIELVKQRLNDGDKAAMQTISYVFSETLKLLHPFMPFITEEIWQTLPHDGESIMISKWPEYNPDMNFPDDEANMEKIITAIRAIRNRRAEMNVPPSKKTKVYISASHSSAFSQHSKDFFRRLASASEVEFVQSYNSADSIQIVSDGAVIYIPMSDMVDTEKEIQRLSNEIDKLNMEIHRINKKLSNEGFVSKAPASVIEAEKDKLKKYTDMLDATKSALEKFNGK